MYRDRKRSSERRLEETAVDIGRLDDLISEVQTQVRSLARQRRRAEKHVEITSRRYTVEVALAAREMDAWRDELARLETRVTDLRAEVPAGEESVAAAEAAREAGVPVLAFSARDGGALRAFADHSVVIPTTRTDRAQELHLCIGHIICELVEQSL